MLGIIGIIAFLTVLGLSLVITRVVTVALRLTGLSPEVARFQARSAFTGTGFTTGESEQIVNHPVRRRIIMGLMVIRWSRLDVKDYVSLLNLSGDYEVTQIRVQEGEWIAGKTLQEMDLPNEGVLLLGIVRHDDDYVGAPRGSTKIYPQDTLILYGRTRVLRELDERRADFSGEQAHQQAVHQQQSHLAKQDRQEQKRDAQRH